MKTIGIVGGMSWESSLEYYRIINQEVNKRMGGFHSAKIVMVSVDFDEIERFQQEKDWDAATRSLVQTAKQIQAGGADLLLIATNTMHIMFEEIASEINIPMLHIADAAGREILARGLKWVGLLGTVFTMEMDFYKQRLKEKFDIDVIIPGKEQREQINTIIFSELVKGIIAERSRTKFVDVIAGMKKKGAQAVILGCTEIPLLISDQDSPIPVIDTTAVHSIAAVEMALRDEY